MTINIPQATLDDLAIRLNLSRYYTALDNDEKWEYGVSMTYFKDFVKYWINGYDWRKQERMLNTFSHFTTQIQGLTIHFIHAKSKNNNAYPLLFSHGWPGSFVECLKILPLLTEPEKHGLSSDISFHIVCPSIPGFGFSEAPKERGFDHKKMGDIFHILMLRLGYNKYNVQGGDFGAIITKEMAVKYEDHIERLHTNFPLAFNPIRAGFVPTIKSIFYFLFSKWIFTDREKEGMFNFFEYLIDKSGYFHEQATRPNTLGYSLTDSPIGLAAWILEKYFSWSDIIDGNVESKFTKDEMLTNIMIYWVTNSITSSMRLYKEYCETLFLKREPTLYVKQPTAVASFPKEIFSMPQRMTSFHYNIVRWTEYEKGGHFAAVEEPLLLSKDIREFFKETENLNKNKQDL